MTFPRPFISSWVHIELWTDVLTLPDLIHNLSGEWVLWLSLLFLCILVAWSNWLKMVNHMERIRIPKSLLRGVMCSQEQQPWTSLKTKQNETFHYTKLPRMQVSWLAQRSLDNADFLSLLIASQSQKKTFFFCFSVF